MQIMNLLDEADGYLQLMSKDNPVFVYDKCVCDVVDVSTGPPTGLLCEEQIYNDRDHVMDNPHVKKPVLLLVTDGLDP